MYNKSNIYSINKSIWNKKKSFKFEIKKICNRNNFKYKRRFHIYNSTENSLSINVTNGNPAGSSSKIGNCDRNSQYIDSC